MGPGPHPGGQFGHRHTDGFTRVLELVGTGYKWKPRATAWCSTSATPIPLEFPLPKGITARWKRPTASNSPAPTRKFWDRRAVIRRLRPPDPYKGKGIRYAGEVIRRKVGKAGGR